MERLIKEQIPLTVCPLSNLKLCVVKDLRQHNLKRMLDAGVCVTINADDPSYFGGYVNDNFIACAEAMPLTRNDLLQLAANSFRASFVDDSQRNAWLQTLRDYAQQHGVDAGF